MRFVYMPSHITLVSISISFHIYHVLRFLLMLASHHFNTRTVSHQPPTTTTTKFPNTNRFKQFQTTQCEYLLLSIDMEKCYNSLISYSLFEFEEGECISRSIEISFFTSTWRGRKKCTSDVKKNFCFTVIRWRDAFRRQTLAGNTLR